MAGAGCRGAAEPALLSVNHWRAKLDRLPESY